MAGLVRETASAIAAMHAAHRASTTPMRLWLERVALWLSTPVALGIATAAAAAWIGANEALPHIGVERLDKFPYPVLEFFLTLFAVYVSLAVLAGQRRATDLADLRSQVNLEHTILAEHKVAKVIELLEALRRDHPAIAKRPDTEAAELAKPTDPKDVADAILEGHAKATSGDGALPSPDDVRKP